MKNKILILDDYLPVKKIIIKKLKKYKLIFKNFESQKKLNNYLKRNSFYAIYSAFGYKLDENSLQNLILAF